MLNPTQRELGSIAYWLREIGVVIGLPGTGLRSADLRGADLQHQTSIKSVIIDVMGTRVAE